MSKKNVQKILFVASEAHPLIKTGGLGDVAGSLPPALKALRKDVRLIMPAYREALVRAGKLKTVAPVEMPGIYGPVRLWEGQLPGSTVKLWLVDSPYHFDRPGGPYVDAKGDDWPDNAARFALFARAVAGVALDRLGLGWRPDIVHCNDWQSGLVPALLAGEAKRPAVVFTIHNLAYQGLFPQETFVNLDLPDELWSPNALEFHDQISFMKGGLVFADILSTVSPTYAREICTVEFGHGLEGLLRHRAHRLVGILNGADYNVWDPAHDKLIPRNYDVNTLELKAKNKSALQERFQLPVDGQIPVIGFVGRLAWQKGVDTLLGMLDELLAEPVQLVVLGSGDKTYERDLRAAPAQYSGRIAVHIGYSEELAHLIESGADMFVMPSRYEPCGLNQIYSLRYGTAPIVRRTGGLADTVVDATEQHLNDGTATGFVFDDPTPASLLEAVRRALALYRRPPAWRRLLATGMARDFSWRASARHYLALYEQARRHADAESPVSGAI